MFGDHVIEGYPRSRSTSTETQQEAVLARKAPNIPLPADWSRLVKTGIVHAVALAQIALTAARARASKRRGVVARWRATKSIPFRSAALDLRLDERTVFRFGEEING